MNSEYPVDSKATQKLLYDAGTGRFYLVPSELAEQPGSLTLQDMDGVTYSASGDALEPFACDTDLARDHLVKEFDAALKQAGAAFRRLKTLDAMVTGESAGPSGEEGEVFFHRLMGVLTGDSARGPVGLLRAIEILNAAGPGASDVNAELTSLFSDDEQTGLIGTVMARLRDIAGKLDASVLTENDHPAGWVEVLHRELFPEETARAKTRQQRRIRSAVSQSIADGLRQRGLTPSADFTRKKSK